MSIIKLEGHILPSPPRKSFTVKVVVVETSVVLTISPFLAKHTPALRGKVNAKFAATVNGSIHEYKNFTCHLGTSNYYTS